MDAVNVFLPSKWSPDHIDASMCNRRSALGTFDTMEEFGLLEPLDPFELSVERRTEPDGTAASTDTQLCMPHSESDDVAVLDHVLELRDTFARACHRRVRSASVFLPSSDAPGVSGFVPQPSNQTQQAATLSMADLVPPQRWIEGAPQAKRQCCWDGTPISREAVGYGVPEEMAGNDSLMSRVSSCTAAIDTEMIIHPASENSPQLQGRCWPSRFTGLTSPFAMPKVYSLDDTSLAMLNQRLQATSDQYCSHPKTPPKQVQTPRTMVLSPPVLLRADSTNDSSLPGIKITRIPSTHTPRSSIADASPCIVLSEAQ